MKTFNCERWTETGGYCCPDGVVRPDCPALIRKDVASRRIHAAVVVIAIASAVLAGVLL